MSASYLGPCGPGPVRRQRGAGSGSVPGLVADSSGAPVLRWPSLVFDLGTGVLPDSECAMSPVPILGVTIHILDDNTACANPDHHLIVHDSGIDLALRAPHLACHLKLRKVILPRLRKSWIEQLLNV
jgi:hypothetical protein